MQLTGDVLQILDSSEIPDNMLEVTKYNDVYVNVNCQAGIRHELVEYFTFEVPGAKFMPSVRNKYWDGKIRLYNSNNKMLYAGLAPYVEKFAEERNYDCNIELEPEDELSAAEAYSFIEGLNIPLKVRDYQFKAFLHSVRNRRCLLLSPTASGKSLVIYMLVQYYGAKSLVIVPTTSLVYQMEKDFISYGMNPDDIHIVMAGLDKVSDKRVIISTWQSVHKLNKDTFDTYDVIVGDEAHLFKAKSLTSIMTKLESCKYRFGFTGTLDDTQTHRLVLEGLFGPVNKVIDTKQLIDRKQLADFVVEVLILKHPIDICKGLRKAKYQDEVDYLVRSEARNRFITNLALSLKGNTLLLFQYVDKHGKVLYNNIKDRAAEKRKIFFVYGGTEAKIREDIRAITENEKDAIIVASFGTFSTGINIVNLSNIVFSSPTKSRIRTLQSIGRGLRRSKDKMGCRLFDIADDLSIKEHRNYTLGHFMERMKMYNDEKFDYKIHNIRLK